MSNDATLAPARKVRTAKAPTLAPRLWEAEFNAARDRVVALLEAVHHDEEGGSTEIFYHLTGVAARILAAETVKDSPSQDSIASTFFEALALCRASQLGGEDMGETNLSLVRQAYEALHLLAIGEPSLMKWPEPAGEKPTPAASFAAPMTAEGYSAEQLKSILEIVAGRTRTLQQLLMLALGDDEPCMQSVTLDAACIIATSIGAMTDTAVGEAIIGGHDTWNYGPLFSNAGTAVRA